MLADQIELFIKELMGEGGEVALQRNALAQYFSCAPSQINYVLSTRFTLERGYVTVSRRGGGGYIRIWRVDTDGNTLLSALSCSMGDALTQREAKDIIRRLHAEGELSDRESMLMFAVSEGCSMPTQEQGDALRARLMKNMLSVLLQQTEEENG